MKQKFRVGDVVTNTLGYFNAPHLPGIICNVQLNPYGNGYLYDLVWNDGDQVYHGFQESELFFCTYQDFMDKIEDRLG